MPLNAKQLREHVVRPALETIQLWSQAAEHLVMGTAAQESHLEFLVQLNEGPALGLFQMEGATCYDIWDNYLMHRPDLSRLVRRAIGTEGRPVAGRMVWDLRYAAIMCRIHYRRVPKKLPDEHDIPAMAAYWKRYYNTPAGAGTEQEFIDNFRRVA